jgi:hypothetical protein
MTSRQKTNRAWGAVLFIIGVILGTMISVMSVWANLEADFYGFDNITNNRLEGLSCPLLMTSTESAVISLKIENPNQKAIEPLVRADISTPILMQEWSEKVRVEPGQTRTLEWQLTPDNIDLGFFIMSKVYVYPTIGLPLREASCGVFVLNLPGLIGGQVLALMVVLSLGGMVGGIFMWRQASQPVTGRKVMAQRGMIFLSQAVILSMILGMFAGWLEAGMLLVLIVITVVGLLVFMLIED